MKLRQRLLFYIGGFCLGLIILYFILDRKNASFDYLPNARVLKELRSKKRTITPETLLNLENNGFDTSDVSQVLTNGKVLFSESNTTLDSCKIYVIQENLKDKVLKLYVENCAKGAIVKSVVVLKK